MATAQWKRMYTITSTIPERRAATRSHICPFSDLLIALSVSHDKSGDATCIPLESRWQFLHCGAEGLQENDPAAVLQAIEAAREVRLARGLRR
jgi:hypothetical protein